MPVSTDPEANFPPWRLDTVEPRSRVRRMEQAQAQKEIEMSTLQEKIEMLDAWVAEARGYAMEVLALESMIDDGLSPHLEAAATELLEDRQSLLSIAQEAASSLRSEVQFGVVA